MKRPKQYQPVYYFEGIELSVAQAIYDKDKRELKKLLEQKTVDVNKPGKEGYTFLQYAVDLMDYDMMKILLESGADPNVLSPITNVPGAGKQTAPRNAAPVETVCYSKYHIKYLKLLVKYGADINERRTVSPLFNAMLGDQKDKIEFLLKNGADVNIVAERGTAPLIAAADLARWDLVEELLDLGADPFLVDKNCSLQKSIQYYINRTEGTPESKEKVRQLIVRLGDLGMNFDFSKARIKITD